MTLGALAVTGNAMKRDGAGIPLVHATPMPYDDYFDGDVPDFLYLERLLSDGGSGLNTPAAVIVETVQGEGGINAARAEWLRRLAELCKKHERSEERRVGKEWRARWAADGGSDEEERERQIRTQQ